MSIGSTVGAILCLTLAIPATAAMRYTMVTEIKREGDRVKTERLVEQVTVDGNKGRIDFLAPGGTKPESGGYMLTLDGGETFVWSDAKGSVCGNWSLEEFFATVGALLERGSNLIGAELPEAQVEKALEEPGPEMLGYATTHLRLHTNFGAKGRILIVKIEYQAEQTDDLWMTSQLELPALERRWLEGMARTGFDYADAMSTAWNAHVSGAVLKHINVVRLTDLTSDKVSVKTETTEVTELEMLESSQIPESTFSAPKCRQASKGELKKKAKRFIRDTLK